MIADENKQHVIETWKAFGSGDAELIRGHFKPDAVWIAQRNNPTAVALGVRNSFGEQTSIAGAGQIADFIANQVPKLFGSDRTVEFKGIYAAGNVVVVEERLRATLANGRRYDNDYCFVFELEDGLITVMREYMDTAKGFRMIFGPEAGARMELAASAD